MLRDVLKIGKEEGLIEGLRQSVIDAIEFKFGYVEDNVREKVNQISDVNQLKELHRKVILANSLNEIV